MSTKITLKHYPKEDESEKHLDFHFYREFFDDNNLYLETNIENLLSLDIETQKVRLKIPVPVFLEMSKVYIDVDSDMLYFDDRESLEEWVTACVADRLQTTRKQEQDDASAKFKRPSFDQFGGWGVHIYGPVTDPIETQIANGVEYWSAEIVRQKRIWKEISKIKNKNTKGENAE